MNYDMNTLLSMMGASPSPAPQGTVIPPIGQLRTKGPFNLTQNTQTVRFRSRGRQARIKLENDATGTEWRYGDLRLDIQEDGLR